MRRLLIPFMALASSGCNDGQSSVLGGVPAIVYVQRTVEGIGNVFDFTVGGTHANLWSLTPPTASGVKKNLTDWKGGDISSADLSFDAREVVFAGKAPGDSNYHLFRVNVDGSNPCDAELGRASQGPCQITEGPFDHANPVYAPGGFIMFVTSENVEGPATPQFRDEYERATTAQLGKIKRDGSGRTLGPRNVSHRVYISALKDGRFIATEWRHMGDVNDGHLTIFNQDMTGVREAFGSEGKGLTNNYLRAREIEPGKLIAIGTARDDTYQAGKLLLVDLGGSGVDTQSEARSQARDLTPNVPGGMEPSYKGVGRYFDAAPLAGRPDQYLVSWADGVVQQEILTMAKASPDFGIYVYDAARKELFPVANEVGSWEYNPIAVVQRAEPPMLSDSTSAQGTQATLLAAINVTDSSLFGGLRKGDVKMVRISEGFSAEEGFPNNFGLTEFDGMAQLGVAPVAPDGSFKALVPPNTPVRMQLLDKYGMAINSQGGVASEPFWIQGRPGEARVCGGCHEDRTKTLQIAPGSSVLQATGATVMSYEGKRSVERRSDVFTADKVMGVPWDKALQPIFDRACVDCHDGQAGAANPTYSITDLASMMTTQVTFDLTSRPVTLAFGDMMYTYSASHVSLLGPEMAVREAQVMVTGEINVYVSAGSYYLSTLSKLMNPPARYPLIDEADRAFGTTPQHPADKAGSYNGFDRQSAKYQLTPDEHYLLILMADSGGQYFTRENKPGGTY